MLRSVWAQRSLCILSHFHASPARFGGQASCQCCYCVCRAPSILLHKVIVRLENNIQHCKGHSFLRPGKFPCISKEKKPLNSVFGDVKLSKSKAVPAVNSRISDLWFCIFSVSGRGAQRGPVLCWAVTLCFSQLVFRSRGSIRGAAPGAAPVPGAAPPGTLAVLRELTALVTPGGRPSGVHGHCHRRSRCKPGHRPRAAHQLFLSIREMSSLDKAGDCSFILITMELWIVWKGQMIYEKLKYLALFWSFIIVNK